MRFSITHPFRLALYLLGLRPLREGWWWSLRALKYAHKRLTFQYHRYSRLVQRQFYDLDAKYGTYEDDAKALDYFARLSDLTASLPYQPKFSVLVPVYKVAPALLRETLASVAGQSYPHWELCVVDDASASPDLDAIIADFARRHPGQVKVAANPVNSHISVTSNRCLELATGDYVALLDHDDRLTPNALGEMARFINMDERPDVLYSDERVISASGDGPNQPFLKPDWSPFLHLSVNYTTHLSVYARALIQGIGGFRVGFEGSQDHDLMLRAVEATKKPVVHVPMVLYQWRATPTSTASGIAAKPYAADAGVKAVTEACARRGMPADVEWEPSTVHYRVRFHLPRTLPKISILIPTRDRPALIKACLKTVFEKSTYANFEVLVIDNGSKDPEALAYLQAMTQQHPGKISILRDEGSFNFGRLNNLAAREATGEYLLLLNNDTEVETPEWMEEMLRCAQLPSIGAVGCKLLYPDRTIQHAGILLIDRKIACHALRTLPADTHAYISMGQTMHEVSGVTAACMMISKAKYLAAGGLDEVYLPNGFGDVDLCLKLQAQGYSNLYTPYATLIHHESKSRGKNVEVFEKAVMLRRWGQQLLTDPYLHFQLIREEHYQQSPEEFVLDASNYVQRQHWENNHALQDGPAPK